MKIYTQNLHSYIEGNIFKNLEVIAEFIAHNDIDVICFQEVAQYYLAEEIEGNLKNTNTIISLKNILQKKYNLNYYLSIDMFKRAFDIYDEGIAILSKYKIIEQDFFVISNTKDYNSWQKRKAQIVKIDNKKETIICNGHFGWTTEQERFENQIDKLISKLDFNEEKDIIITGDFNVDDSST